MSKLGVIVVYFNPFNEEPRSKVTIEFIEYLSEFKDMAFILMEAGYSNSALGLKDRRLNVPFRPKNMISHFSFTSESLIWHKENLINMGVSKMPAGIENIAWIDSDMEFCNPNWVQDTLEELETHHVVQMYDTIDFVEKDGNISVTRMSSIADWRNSSGWSIKGSFRSGQCGGAWAMRRESFIRINGLPEFPIVGGADRDFVCALFGNIELLKKEKSPNEWLWFQSWASKVKEASLVLGYTRGTILHKWHGDMGKRADLSDSRKRILVDEDYNPYLDIYYNSGGLLELSNRGLRMQPAIANYFKLRSA